MPQTFKDAAGRDWSLAVNVMAVERVRQLTDTNILALVEDNCTLMAKLGTDPMLLFRVLYGLLKPQLDAKGVTDEQFSDALVGDAIGHAYDALVLAIADFFPDQQRRKAISTLLAKANQVGELAIAQALREAEGIDPSAVLTSLKIGSGSAPAPSASTPTPSPSGT